MPAIELECPSCYQIAVVDYKNQFCKCGYHFTIGDQSLLLDEDGSLGEGKTKEVDASSDATHGYSSTGKYQTGESVATLIGFIGKAGIFFAALAFVGGFISYADNHIIGSFSMFGAIFIALNGFLTMGLGEMLRATLDTATNTARLVEMMQLEAKKTAGT